MSDIRIRERNSIEALTSDLETYQFYSSSSSGGPWAPGISGSTQYVYDSNGEYEYIADEVCTKGETPVGRKFRYKPVTHIRIKYDGTPPFGWSAQGRHNCSLSGSAFIKYENYHHTYPRYGDTVALADTFFSAFNIDSIITNEELARTASEIQPTLDSLGAQRVNAYTILLELGDIKKLLPGIKDSIYNPKSTPLGVADNAAGGWLTWNWGVVPLVNDLNDLNGLMLKVDAAIDKWNDFAAAGKVMNFHRTIRSHEDGTSTDNLSTFNSFIYCSDRLQTLGDFKYKAVMSLYVKPILVEGADRFRLKLRSLGLDKPFSGIWEAVPFSWLIDYVTNIGDMISAIEETAKKLFRYEIVDFGYSTKMNKYYTWKKTSNSLGGTAFVGRVTLEKEEYNRYPLSHSFLAQPDVDFEWDGKLSPTEITNLAALGRRTYRQ
jgi:hypothetical protein